MTATVNTAILHLPRLEDPTSVIVGGLLLMAFATFASLAISALIRRSREPDSSATELWRPPAADTRHNSAVNDDSVANGAVGGPATVDDLDREDRPGGGLPAL